MRRNDVASTSMRRNASARLPPNFFVFQIIPNLSYYLVFFFVLCVIVFVLLEQNNTVKNFETRQEDLQRIGEVREFEN